jgi:superfamily II DNA or RNA helicase
MMTKIFSQSLTFFCPRYLIGLSATPFRPDGYDVFLDLYFGKEKVVRNLYRPHQVLLYETNINIKHDQDGRGDMIWQSVIDNQTKHEERNMKIVSLCIKFKTRSILILSKRIAQINALNDLLLEKNESVTMIKEGDGAFDKEARILIATYQKVGTGFSHDKLDMLILATDAESYFLQYLGRVFRTQDVQPIIIDIVDNHPVLKKHFKSRKIIYEQAGGKIQKYNTNYLDLSVIDK